MRVIWRFFVAEDARWHWQQLSYDRAVVAESRQSYCDCAHCMKGAVKSGYTYAPAQPRLHRGRQQPYRWR